MGLELFTFCFYSDPFTTVAKEPYYTKLGYELETSQLSV